MIVLSKVSSFDFLCHLQSSGGATDIRTEIGNDSSRLVVAGGGGGGSVVFNGFDAITDPVNVPDFLHNSSSSGGEGLNGGGGGGGGWFGGFGGDGIGGIGGT